MIVGSLVQPVQDDPGGLLVAAYSQLVVVVVVAAEDPHAIGDEKARPGVVHGGHIADNPAAGTGLRLDRCALPGALVFPHGDRVQDHVARFPENADGRLRPPSSTASGCPQNLSPVFGWTLKFRR
jgi:hypothetical protein